MADRGSSPTALPGDLGDPAFLTGVLAWGSDHWLALFSGNLGAASTFWDAPIFYPERVATALSEHIALHSLLTLPVYLVTRNAVLCYNLWFLATFVLSAFGMYLLVRDLTGRPGAAVVAGLAFGFAPYRIATLAHLQVLSSHWMPFVLLGLRRYVATGNSNALLGAGAALWAQNLVERLLHGLLRAVRSRSTPSSSSRRGACCATGASGATSRPPRSSRWPRHCRSLPHT